MPSPVAKKRIVVAALALVAASYVAFGVQWLLGPEAMATPLGIVLTNGDASSDARAVYGGLELGLGVFLLYCASSQARRSTGMAAATLTLFGLGSTRLVGIAWASGGVTGATTQLLATDLLGATLCAGVWVLARSLDAKAGGQ